MFGFPKKCTSGKIRVSFLVNIRNVRVTIACAITVATAAPMIRIAGNGPRPKIRTGSRMILTIRPDVVARKAALLFPSAVKIPVKL